jgi:predicted ATPase
VHDLSGFRAELRSRRRAAGRTQQQLARAAGLHPDVLSHKLNGSDGAVLTVVDAVGLITVLAEWGLVASQAEAEQLLILAGVAPRAIAVQARASPVLAALPPGSGAAAPPGVTPPGVTRPGLAPLAVPPPRPRLAPTPPPAQATALIGRERELAQVAAALTASRLVTLTGAGGAGKTRLAVQTAADQARQSAGSVAFVSLAQVGDPELLPVTIAAALGLAPKSMAAALDHLTAALTEHDLLLVLDNLEHLLDAVPLISRLLAAAPAVRILTTSRIPLRLSGEQIVRVPPLSLPGDDPAAPPEHSEAVRLFAARAEAVRAGFADQPGDVTAMAEICTCLDGLPLAIELAAARVRLYPPRALLPMLQSRLQLLTGGPRDQPTRQQTLRAALDWSYRLLPGTEQELFRRLGVFAGPFDAAAAAAVTAARDGDAILARLAELADQSLLEITPAATPLFRLLQIVSEYASAQLAEAGEQVEARRRHLAYYLRLAEDVRSRFPAGRKTPELLDVLQTALPNIEAALDFAGQQAGQDSVSLDQGLRLATAAGPLWRWGSRFAEGSLQLSRLLAAGDARQRDASSQTRARAVLEAGDLARVSGHYQQAADLGRLAVEMCEALGDDRDLARAHRVAGDVAVAVGDLAGGAPHLEQAITLARQAGDLICQAEASNVLGQLENLAGHRVEAGQLLRQAVRLYRAAGEPDWAAGVLHSLAETEQDAGHATLAGRLYAIALRQQVESGNKRGIAYNLEGLAAIASRAGDAHRALVLLGAAEVLRADSGTPLPPTELDRLKKFVQPALARLAPEKQRAATLTGRTQPIGETISWALGDR